MRHACTRWFGLGLVALALAGCASMAQRQLADNLGRAVVNQDDPATVQAGAPAFLLLLDGLIEGDPDNVDLLIASARLHAAYALYVFTAFKVYLFDLDAQNQLYRAFSLLVFAAILVVSSHFASRQERRQLA